MNIDDILTTYQSANKGGSGRGNSFYSNAAGCGRRAVLQEAQRDVQAEYGPADADNPLAVGTAYHLMHQVGAEIAPDMVLDMRDSRIDGAFVEGLRLYRGWQELWGSVERKYGEHLGSEVEVACEIDGNPYTGKIDCVVRIDDLEGVRLRTGLQLPEPGVYLLDWKSAKGTSSYHPWQFTQGTQARGYLMMYPDAKGMIFDVLNKVQTFRHEPLMSKDGKKVMAGKSYSHYWQPRRDDDKEIITALVKAGHYNFENNVAIPTDSNCLTHFAGPCPFLLSGACNGF